jgi:uncharacterized protein YndB with AHSA1/START domain
MSSNAPMNKTSPSARNTAKSDERYVYVTYIATTVDRVWQALVDGEITRQYWFGNENVSDWREGSQWQHRTADAKRAVRVMGKVMEIRPPHRLALSWAEPSEVDDPVQHSRVQFDIEAVGQGVRLTVTHDQFAVGSPMPGKINAGWPMVLSSLKTFLETGTGLDFSASPSGCGAK